MIVVVDLGVSNLGSVPNCCKRVGYQAVVSAVPELVAQADKLILPGVGAFDAAMKAMHERGLYDVLQRRVVEDKVPILGICLGMQLLFEGSDEGQESGLGWMPGRFIKFPSKYDDKRLLVPHIGWNTAVPRAGKRLFAGVAPDAEYYFVHSYRLETTRDELIASTTEYGGGFVSAVESYTIMGVQFHPEKSHQFGAHLMKNFLSLT
jgi:imidazole glycerol-phosphate synthase subunit HisH